MTARHTTKWCLLFTVLVSVSLPDAATQSFYNNTPTSHTTGIERFLPDNKFSDYVAELTGQIERTGNLLRAYEDRLQQRFDQRHQHSTAPRETTTEPIERALQTNSLQDTTKIDTFIWQPLQEWVIRNIQNAYLGIISLFRWLFQNPMLVQAVILLGLFWLVFRTVNYFAVR